MFDDAANAVLLATIGVAILIIVVLVLAIWSNPPTSRAEASNRV
jgi:hypothetical protein